jgi:hypothetical protein
LLCLSMTQHEGSRLVPESPNLERITRCGLSLPFACSCTSR